MVWEIEKCWKGKMNGNVLNWWDETEIYWVFDHTK
jgi:hypothetical protein